MKQQEEEGILNVKADAPLGKELGDFLPLRVNMETAGLD